MTVVIGEPTDPTQYMGPSSMHEEAHVLKRELIHLREDIERVKAPRSWLVSVASSAFAIAITALFSGLALLGLKSSTTLDWLRPTLFIAAVAATVLAMVFWILNWRLRDDFIEDMEHVKRRANELVDLSGDR
jgi:hypothetical protein